MTKLEQILTPYDVRGELGSDKQFDREYLRASLGAASKQTSVTFWLAVVAQLGVFLLVVLFALKNATNPKVLGFILAGGGGGIGACGLAIVNLWKQKVATDLTLALVSSLNEDAARATLTVVLDSVRSQRAPSRPPRKQQAGAKP